MMSRIVAVAGNLASGKSTLAAGLAHYNGWVHLPAAGYDVSYIEDLFRDPSRWAFEAQMSFLHHKAEAVRAAMQSDRTAVLDRSVDEDMHIFARYFHERGWMDTRAYDLYQRCATWLVETLAEPSMVVYCYAPPDVCGARLQERQRAYQDLYPPDHIERLHHAYSRWWTELDAPVRLSIDTTVQDLRQDAVAKEIAKIIGEALERC
jgi:deoxyadenosine/deoxycytidine kinase